MSSDVLAVEKRESHLWNDEQSTRQPIWNLVTAWILIIPLLYFAVSGVVRFDSSFKNNVLTNSFETTGEIDIRSRILTLIVVSACAILALSRWKAVTSLLKADGKFLALCVLAMSSTAWSVDSRRTLVSAFYIFVNALFASYLVTRFRRREQMQLMMFVGWLAMFLSIGAALLFPAYGVDHRGIHSTGDWMGIYAHKNGCAVMTTYLLSASLFYSPRGTLARTAHVVYICGGLFLLVMTQARTGWLSAFLLIAFALFYSLYGKSGRRERALLVWGVAAISISASIILANNYVAVLQAMGKDATFTGRTEIFASVFRAILKHSVTGYGYVAFFGSPSSSETSLESGWHGMLSTVDNGYLGIWLDLGIPGLLLFFGTLFHACYNAYIGFRRGRQVGWYASILVLAIVTNTAERMIMLPNYLAWILYMMACLGLRQERFSAQEVIE